MAITLIDDIITNGAGVSMPDFRAYMQNREVTSIKDGGAQGDGSTDDADNINTVGSSSASTIWWPTGTYKTSKQLSFGVNNDVDIHFDDVVIDASAAATAGNFPDLAVLWVGSDVRTQINDLASDVAAGENTLTLTSASSLSEGDIICIYDPTNGSYNAADDAWHAGEFCRVQSQSGTTVKIYGTLYDSYAAATVQVYKMTNRRVYITGKVKIICPTALDTVTGGYFSQLLDSNISGVTPTGSGRAGNTFKRCFNVTGHNYPRQQEDSGLGLQYGSVISNSQHVNLYGYHTGDRHGGVMGGGADTCDVPNTDCHMYGTFVTTGTHGLPAANMHGNVRFCSYHGVMNSVLLAGDNTWAEGVFRNQKNGQCVEFSQLLGWNHRVKGICISNADPNTVTRGVVDLGGNDVTTTTVNTIRGGCLEIDVKIRAPQATGSLIKIVNYAGSPTEKVVLALNVKILEDSGSLSAGIYTNSSNTWDFDLIDLTGTDLGDNDPGYSLLDVLAVRGWRDVGAYTMNGDTGANNVSDTVTFNKKAPIPSGIHTATPVVIIQDTGVSYGTDSLVFGASSITETGFTAHCRTADNGNFSTAVDRTVSYIAMLEQ